MYIYKYKLHTYICRHTHMRTVYKHMCTHVPGSISFFFSMYIYIHVYAFICLFMCSYIYIFIHTCTAIHPYLKYTYYCNANYIYICLMHLVPGSLNILPGCSLMSRRPILARYASMPAKFTQDDEVGDCRFAVQCMS